MPKGTTVERMYEGLKKRGFGVASAVRIAQAQTGKSLATGKAPKSKSPSKSKGTGKGLMGR